MNIKSVEDIPSISKTVTQEQIGSYAMVSGDNNLVHLDPTFAARSSFGTIVAHGMLTLAFISEMLTKKFGRPWLETGNLKVKFKHPAYPGDKLITRGHISKQSFEGDQSIVECFVAISNSNRQDLVTGTAKIIMPIEGDIQK